MIVTSKSARRGLGVVLALSLLAPTALARPAVDPNGTLGAPVAVSPVSDSSRNPEVAIDAEGRALVSYTWLKARNIQVTEKAPGSYFGLPANIGNSSFGEDSDVDIADGVAATAWIGGADDGQVYVSLRDALGGWGDAIQLSDLGPSEGSESAHVSVSDSGQVVVSWDRSDAEGNWSIQAAIGATDGTFGAAQTLSRPATQARSSDLGVDGAGNAVVVWESYGDVDSTDDRIEYALAPAGQPFGAAETLHQRDQDDTSPEVAVNEAGRVVVVWGDICPENGGGPNCGPGSGGFRAESAVGTTSGGFTVDEQLSEGRQKTYDMDVAIDAAGNAVAAWNGPDDTDGDGSFDELDSVEVALLGPEATTFLDPTPLLQEADLGEDDFDTAIGGGIARVVWSDYLGYESTDTDVVRMSTWDPAVASWTIPQVISSEDEDAYDPRIAMNDEGVTVVSWYGPKGDYDVVRAAYTDLPITGVDMTLSVNVRRGKVIVKGSVLPPHFGEELSVLLEKKRNGRFRDVGVKTPALNDRSRYRAAFPSPGGRCRVTVSFHGDNDHRTTRASETFDC